MSDLYERCKYCNGDGYTSEHAPHPHSPEDCAGMCPVQVQCEYCQGIGFVLLQSQSIPGEQITDEEILNIANEVHISISEDAEPQEEILAIVREVLQHKKER